MEEVSAFIGEQPPDRPFEDMVAAVLKFTNQAYGTIHFSLNIPHGASTLEVHGSQGSLFATDTTDQWWGGGGGEKEREGGREGGRGGMEWVGEWEIE